MVFVKLLQGIFFAVLCLGGVGVTSALNSK